MHSVLRVGHFIVEIFVSISEGMGGIMDEVVRVHLVVMQEHTAVEVLRQEVKSHVVDVRWHDLIDGVLLVAPVDREREWKVTSFQKSHLTLVVLILTCVIPLISVSNTDSSCQSKCLIVLELSSSECLL